MISTRLARACGLAAALALSGPAAGTPFNDLFVFGDSLSDGGNFAAAADNSGGAITPTRVSAPFGGLVPNRPYDSSNRFSNGPVWVEQMAGVMGVASGPSLLGGPNSAYGGARAVDDGPFPPGLPSQVQGFLTATGGVAPSDALYVLWAGGNDARAVAGGADPNTTVANAVNSIVAQVVALNNAGATHFLIPNLPDLGLTPETLAAEALVPGTAAAATLLAQGFNGALSLALFSLNFSPTIHAIGMDVFSLVQDVVASPASYGLSVANQSCVQPASVCTNPDQFLFWDGIHPTTAGHAILADTALRLLGVVPEPATVALVLVALVPLARRRAHG